MKLRKADKHFDLLGDAIVWGWRNIGRELGVSERTARTYGKERGLPFHYSPSGYVWAIRYQVKLWFLLCSFVRRARKANKINCAGISCLGLLSIEELEKCCA